LLEDADYEVRTADDLREARAALAGVSCIVLDLGLPDGTADILVRELADRPDAPALVVMSAALNTAEFARHYGVMYLRKPFELELVLAAVKVASSQRMQPIVQKTDDIPTVRFRRGP
jgi:DNA-binding response OmpR family regulator